MMNSSYEWSAIQSYRVPNARRATDTSAPIVIGICVYRPDLDKRAFLSALNVDDSFFST